MKKLIVAILGLFFIFCVISYLILDISHFKLTILILAFVSSIGLLITYYNKKTTEKIDAIKRHLDQRIALSAEIALFPLPPFTGYAISPDTANEIAFLIKKEKPNLILELGSGLSTVIIAMILKKIGHGKLVSVEHDKKYLDKTREYLEIHGLSQLVKLIHAPLKEIHVGGRKFLWYTPESFKSVRDIDMLIVDGPPGNTCKLARFPAMPVLYEKLSKNAIVVIDDMVRKDEQEMLKKWVRIYKDIKYELLNTDRGMAVIYVSKSG